MKTHPEYVLKYCPRCGSPHFITQDSGRSFRCEDCLFIYFVNSSAAVACLILNPEGHLLLCRRAEEPEKDKLDLPGGFVDPMESAEQAVKREIREELKVEILKQKFLTSFPNEYVYSGYSVFTLDLAFLCEIDSFDEIVPGDDISSVEFWDPQKINMEDLYSESMQNIINYYILNYSK